MSGEYYIVSGEGKDLAAQGPFLGHGGIGTGGGSDETGAHGISGKEKPSYFKNSGIRRMAGDRNYLDSD